MELIDKNTKYMLSKPFKAIKPDSVVSYEFLGGKDVMPIGGFFGPYICHIQAENGFVMPDYFSDEIYGLIAQSGINMIVHYNTVNKQVTKKMLLQGEKHNIGLFAKSEHANAYIEDKHNDPIKPDESVMFDKEEFKKEVAQYANYKSFLGLHTRDEPFDFYMPTIKEVAETFLDMGYNGKTCCSNAIYSIDDANTVYTAWKRMMDKSDYLNMFVDSTKTGSISVTWYPFETEFKDSEHEKTILKNYFKILSEVKKICKQRELALWRMLEAGSDWNDAAKWLPSTLPHPSEGETLWNINVSLAYGAKAIQYFCLIQPLWFAQAEGGVYDCRRNGIIGADGKPNSWFYFAEKANKQIRAIDHVLMNCASVGIIVAGEQAESIVLGGSVGDEIIKDKQFRQLKTVCGDVLIGCFDNKGKTALYVVNFWRDKQQKITLGFDDRYGYDITYNAQTISVAGKEIELDLEPGNAALVLLH